MATGYIVVCFQRKTEIQERMDNPETHSTLAAQNEDKQRKTHHIKLTR